MAISVYIGKDLSNPDFSFDADSIMEVHADTAVNLIVDEMTADTAEVTVRYDDEDMNLRNLMWGTPVYIFNGEIPVGKFLAKRVVRTGSMTYKIECTSLVGLLEYDTYYGGMFTGESFKDVVENIITTNGLTSFLGAGISLRRTLTDPNNPNFDPAFIDLGEDMLVGSLGLMFVATFTINKSLLEEANLPELANKTFCRDVIWGTACDPNISTADTVRERCGIYMDMTRASTSDPWADYGEVFFAMGGGVYSLGTPTEPTTYRIAINSSYTTINGTTYSPSNKPTVANKWMQRIFGGLLIINDSLDVVPGSYPHDVTYSRHRIYSNGQLFYLDGIVYQNKDGELIPGNGVDGTYITDPIANAVINSGDYVSFQSEAEYQNEIMNAIQYSDGIESLPVYGWMPVCTKRQALHQLLFSQGVILRKSETGDLLFTVPTTRYYNEIPSDRIYNEGSEEFSEHTNSIVVTEHEYSYDADDASVAIYSSDDSISGGAIVQFTKAPAYYAKNSIRPYDAEQGLLSGISNIRYFAGNCNAAILGVSYYSDTTACIKGSDYAHEDRSVVRRIGNYPDGKDISVSDVTLVTSYNAEVLADRLESYYGEAYTVKNGILLNNENNGGYYKFVSPFHDEVYGFLKQQSLSFSSNIKANCEFVVNYNPPPIGDGFTDYVILTGSGTWQVPESVLQSDSPRIKVVLIGGGQGGESGYAGANGASAAKNAQSTQPALGGNPGKSGKGGNIFQITINNPPQSLSYSAGTGGAGGTISSSHDTNNTGTNGTDSTVTYGIHSYSSADGEPSDAGYLNFIANEIYGGALKFYKWGNLTETQDPMSGTTIRFGQGYGGDGGNYSWITLPGAQNQTLAQIPGHDAQYYCSLDDADYVVSGKHGGYGLHYPRNSSTITSSAGMPGGAGIGEANDTSANGGSGGNASSGRAGNGGSGGNATWIPPKATDFNPKYYGYGGFGGGGGGAGGSSGWTRSGTIGTGGTGGYGGVGGDGGDGCILIYY